jgi:hypothetical protein
VSAFDAAVLDSGDYLWLNWMCGYDWTPAAGPLPWTPRSRAAEIGR